MLQDFQVLCDNYEKEINVLKGRVKEFPSKSVETSSFKELKIDWVEDMMLVKNDNLKQDESSNNEIKLLSDNKYYNFEITKENDIQIENVTEHQQNIEKGHLEMNNDDLVTENVESINIESNRNEILEIANQSNIFICNAKDPVDIVEIQKQINQKDEIIQELSKKLEDFSVHMDGVILSLSSNSLEIEKTYSNLLNNKEEIKNNIEECKIFRSSLIIELVSSSIFNKLTQKYSLSLDEIIDFIENNFLLYLNTIFMKEPFYMKTSIYHEVLEDIFIRIYEMFIKDKLNDDINPNYNWIISEDDINEILISRVTKDFFEKNPITKMKNGLKDINDQFAWEFNCYIDEMSNISKEFTEKVKINEENIKMATLEKFSQFEEKIQKKISTLIILGKNSIHAGKVMHKSRLIFDYWKLYFDYIALREFNDTRLVYYQSLESPDLIEALSNHIKYRTEKNLKTLYLCGNQMQDDRLYFGKILLEVFQSKIMLRSLTITDTKVDESNLHYICKVIECLDSLNILDISNNGIDDNMFRLIAESLKINQSIHTLYLNNNALGSNSAIFLADLMMKNKSFEKLFLNGNNINDIGLHSLLNILSSHPKLKALDLSNNKLKKNDIALIANYLVKNKILEMLNLSCNVFDPESVNVLGQALKENKSLKILFLNNISLNDDSTPYLLQHLTDTTLTEISLEDNKLGEIGGVLFANVIKYNKRVKRVFLRNTDLNSISLVCISHAVELNNTLSFINLSENNFDENSLKTFMNVARTKDLKVILSKDFENSLNDSESISNILYNK